MAFSQDLEKQINTSLIILGIKIKALKATLTKEQLLIYDKVIQEEKVRVKEVLAKLLTKEEIDEVYKAIDN